MPQNVQVDAGNIILWKLILIKYERLVLIFSYIGFVDFLGQLFSDEIGNQLLSGLFIYCILLFNYLTSKRHDSESTQSEFYEFEVKRYLVKSTP